MRLRFQVAVQLAKRSVRRQVASRLAAFRENVGVDVDVPLISSRTWVLSTLTSFAMMKSSNRWSCWVLWCWAWRQVIGTMVGVGGGFLLVPAFFVLYQDGPELI